MSEPEWNQSVQDFMTAHRVDKGCEYTHTNLSSTPHSFYVPYERLDTFYDLYADAFAHNQTLYVTEKNRHFGPIVVDLDIKFQGDEIVRKYTEHHVKEICRVYSDVIKQWFDVDGVDGGVNIFVMEKKQAYPDRVPGSFKDGIHLVIPGISTRASVKYIIRTAVLTDLAPIFTDMGAINAVEDIVDTAVIERNSWYMYGSQKRSNEPYIVTAAYNVSTNAFVTAAADLVRLAPVQDRVRMFSIRNKLKETPIRDDKHDDVADYEHTKEEAIRRKKVNAKILTSSTNPHTVRYENLDLVKKLIDLLNVNRADAYDDWIRMGWCLRNIDNRLESAWEDFSRKSAKYEAGACGRMWNRMREGGLGIGTLHMWAKQDNPSGYADVIKADLSNIIYVSRTSVHYDVAKVAHHMFQHRFVCASAKGRFWYEYRSHRWQISEAGIALRQRLSEDVWRMYHLEAIRFNNKAIHASNSGDQTNYSETAKKFNEIGLKLGNGPYKDNVMKECAELFYTEKFEEKLDANPNLIGFENGVYDLEEHRLRDGRPEDYITFTTGVNYVEYDPNHPKVLSIKAYMEQVLPNPRVRHYVLKLFATFIHGHVKEQKFYIWTGTGSNSKSKLVELFEKSFGDYCCKFPITLLTQRRAASNAACSELARSKGKRFACLQEPSEDEKINIGLMKELSGGDKIMARALYKEPFEFNPQFKMLLLCNHLPYVPSDDGGTWRRIRVVEFTSKFVENPQESNEYPIDYDLSDKMEHWTEYFMSMLLHYYKVYQEEGLTEPPEVLQCTIDYKSQNDHMSLFLTMKFEKTEGAFITLDEIHSELRSWIRDDCIPMKLPSKPDLMRYMSKSVTKIVTENGIQGIRGYKLRVFNADDTDADMAAT